MNPDSSRKGRRVAILGGVRTPFCRAGGQLGGRSPIDLGVVAARETMLASGIRPGELDQMIFGIVSAPVGAPNIAREIALAAGFPESVHAYTVSQACISANRAITNAADQIALGRADLVLAGGAETLSDVPILYGRRFRDALFKASKAKSLQDRLAAFQQVRPKDLAPVAPAIAEHSSKESMGEAAEKMAKFFGITREAQDRFAAQSHARALAAWEADHFRGRVAAVPVPRRGEEEGEEQAPSVRLVTRDDHPRADSSEEKLAKLRPVFDKKLGSVTAGNSSPLTDGAGAVLLASEERARAEGWEIAGYLRHYEYAAVDPFEHLLMGPVRAVGAALDHEGLGFDDFGVIEMHEAFAAQVLANIWGFADEDYCRDKLGRDGAIGELDPDRVNRWGGSISLGHPFGATGARLVMMLLDQMRDADAEFGLISACAAGAMGSAMIFER
jgi:acetyl-CoA acyltransferase